MGGDRRQEHGGVGVAAHEAPRRRACNGATRTARARAANAGRTRGDQKDRPLVAGLREGNAQRSGGVTASAGRFGTSERGASGKGAERAVRSAERTGGRRVLQPGLWVRMRRRSGGHGAATRNCANGATLGAHCAQRARRPALRRPLRCPSVAPRT
ncbi:hypothetical protein ERJ75_000653200 [Trypanosoma vivax]|nr:hypothetical protein ERJ75_000653200 [Trypanosoma vivax]